MLKHTQYVRITDIFSIFIVTRNAKPIYPGNHFLYLSFIFNILSLRKTVSHEEFARRESRIENQSHRD